MPKRGIAAVRPGPSKYVSDSDSEGSVNTRSPTEESTPPKDIHSLPLPTPQRPRTKEPLPARREQSSQFLNQLNHAFDEYEDEEEEEEAPVDQDIELPDADGADSQQQPSPDAPASTLSDEIADLELDLQRACAKKPTPKQRPATAPQRDPEPIFDFDHEITVHHVEVPPDTMSWIPPNQQRNMRACMVCSIVRTYNQFVQSGCPNCDSFLELQGNGDAVTECTSQVFDGLLTVSDTSRSWVARHQRLEGYVPGVYAVQVEGVLPDDAMVAAENAGVHYVPRDGTVDETLPTEN